MTDTEFTRYTVDSEAERPTRIPPYVSYKTFKTFLDDLNVHGVPNRIDRSVLMRFSGTVGTQLLSALRWLRLIGLNDEPTDDLRNLANAHGSNDWQTTLTAVVADRYAFVMNLDLARITPGQLSEVFRKNFTSKEDVLRKCEAFFLHAVQDAGIEINARILKRTRQQRAASPRRRARTQEPKDTEPEETPAEVATPYENLIEILDPSKMDDQEQQAVWTLIRYLRKQEISE